MPHNPKHGRHLSVVIPHETHTLIDQIAHHLNTPRSHVTRLALTAGCDTLLTHIDDGHPLHTIDAEAHGHLKPRRRPTH